MARSMCILFVALAIFQAVVAGVVEHREIVRLESTKVVGSLNDVFGVERGSCSIGVLTVGRKRSGESTWTAEYKYTNNENRSVSVGVNIDIGRETAHYVRVANQNMYAIRICDTDRTLGSGEVVVILNVPSQTTADVEFTIGAH